MANYKLKILKDNDGTPFMPLTSTDAVYYDNDHSLADKIDELLPKTGGEITGNLKIDGHVEDTLYVEDLKSKNLFFIPDGKTGVQSIDMTWSGSEFKAVRTANVGNYYPAFIFLASGGVETSDWWKETSSSSYKPFTKTGRTYTVSVRHSGTTADKYVYVGWSDGTTSRFWIGKNDSRGSMVFQNITKNINFIEIAYFPNTTFNETLQIQIEEGDEVTNFVTPKIYENDRRFCQASLSSNQTLAFSGTQYQALTIPLNSMDYNKGIGSLSNNKIKIGKNINYIKCSYTFNFHSSSGGNIDVTLNARRTRNGTTSAIKTSYFKLTTPSIATAEIIVGVEENDEIDFTLQNQYSTKTNVIIYSANKASNVIIEKLY